MSETKTFLATLMPENALSKKPSTLLLIAEAKEGDALELLNHLNASR